MIGILLLPLSVSINIYTSLCSSISHSWHLLLPPVYMLCVIKSLWLSIALLSLLISFVKHFLFGGCYCQRTLCTFRKHLKLTVMPVSSCALCMYINWSEHWHSIINYAICISQRRPDICRFSPSVVTLNISRGIDTPIRSTYP